MLIADFQKRQTDLTETCIARACEGLPEEQQEGLRSHAWSLDLSDMVWECCRCYAVLHYGDRRLYTCRGSVPHHG